MSIYTPGLCASLLVLHQFYSFSRHPLRVEVLALAEQDLYDGYDFYESQRVGLGDYFLKSLRSDILALGIRAGIHRKRLSLFRVKLKKFPYWVYYAFKKDVVYVLTVLDTGQDPVTIRQREKKEAMFSW
ncbi:MAG: hypothetical protein K2W99_06225 [Chthoniobacterales bacterium]|nr:hypothetical protein [Chthoniobacterales bacterium]